MTFDTNGWAAPEPSSESKVYYVSSETGSNSNDGLAPERPFKTVAYAVSKLRHGYPDWIRLKCGDVFIETPVYLTKSGMSPERPMVITSYGEGPRPFMDQSGFFRMTAPKERGCRCDNIAILGIRFRGEGAQWLGPSNGLWIEDCELTRAGLTIQSFYGTVENVTFRRNVVRDNHVSGGGKAQGIYCDKVKGLTITECVFSHNGWMLEDGATPSILNHNIYISAFCTNLSVVDNIILDGSSHGLQARCGGIVRGNVFLRNPISMSFGLVEGSESDVLPGGVCGEIVGNLILEGCDIGRDGTTPRGIGIQVANLNDQGTTISQNMIIDGRSARPYGMAIEANAGKMGVGVQHLTIDHNTIYDWDSPIFFGGTWPSRFGSIGVYENIIQNPNRNTSLIRCSHKPDADLQTMGNRYWSKMSPLAWFRVDELGASYGVDGWNQLTGESSIMPSIAEDVEFRHPNVGVDDWLTDLGLASANTYDDFVGLCCGIRRGQSLGLFCASAIIAWYREQYFPIPHYDIGRAMANLKKGGYASRRSWRLGSFLVYHPPTSGGILSEPLITVDTAQTATVWKPTYEDLLATDWKLEKN